ncbi:N-terminal kinase-like protein isoform X2 [Penaeus chinensis]|uniref:N-terminal kinase-like protein isoform X2 n=1 Tax=Penaeus chinensis TaxID=139456 RepID=UPI001FB62046|nr:N-terminal kinase-like protein isoform X2 [Penaeus chinensis]
MWSLFSRDPTSSFGYEIGEAVEHTRAVWKMHRGKKKQNGDEVSVFICEGTSAQLDIAKAAVKRLKTLRHPCILTYVDSLENEKLVYLVTEPVTPLLTWLKDSALSPSHRTSAVSWGLLQVTKGLSFLNNDGKLIHYNVCGSSVFVTPGGEWKLGGVEYASSDSSMFPVKVLPELEIYNPPEKMNPSKMRTTTMWAADMWGLGCLIWEVFNGLLDESFSLKSTQKLPKSLIETYTKLVGANPGTRPNPRDVVEDLRKPGQFFRNDLIETLLFLEEIHLKDANEKHKFFANLTPKLENIPNYIATNKILPTVISAHEFSNVGSVVLSPLFKIGKLLGEAEYQRQILPTVVKLFSSSDRATRLKLLQQMESLVEYMDPKTVNDQVFPQLATGFSDSNPTIREQTVKSIMFLAPKLNYNNLNIEVLKHFARLQLKDEQGGIRTNTTVCLGKVAQYLHPDIRQKCLTSAFTRAMRDPFPPARIAGIMAIAATQQYYPLQEVVSKILPSLCHLTLDPEKSVRDAVFRVLKGFLSKVEKVSEDPSLKEVMEAEVKSASSSSQTTWTGWAVGAITSKFYKTSSGAQPQKQASTSSSGTVTPSTKTSSVASTPSQGRASSNTPNSAAPNEDDKSDYEDWENSEWQSMDDGINTKPRQSPVAVQKSPTVSEALADVGDMDGGDGWGDDTEEWGSLEDTQGKFGSVSQRSTAISSQSTTSTGWDDWDGKSPTESSSIGGNYKGDDQRRLREEKRLQRQKEIEAKRAARAGPMKLGAKKI